MGHVAPSRALGWQQVLSTEPHQKCLTGNRVSTGYCSEVGVGCDAAGDTPNHQPQMSVVQAAHAEVLDLEVIVEAVFRAFAALAGFLHSAERRHLVRDDAFVDADDAVLEAFCNPPDPSNIPRIEIAGKADWSIVRHLYGFFFRFEPEQRRDRPEYLLTEHAHLVVDVGQYRRVDEIRPEFVAPAAGGDLRTALHRIVDEAEYIVGRILADERPDAHALCRAVPDLELGCRGHQLFAELIVNAILHQDAVGADAGLPCITELADNRALHGLIHVRIVK